MRSRRAVVSAMLCIAMLTGCSAHEAQVSGVVTLDGQPLNDGLVTFHPVSGGALAYSRISSGGRFELRTGSQGGLSPGEYQATVAANGPVPAPTAKNREPIAPLITPLKYNQKETSGFSVSVAPGDNVVNLDLMSK